MPTHARSTWLPGAVALVLLSCLSRATPASGEEAAQTASTSAAEVAALRAFYEALNGARWKYKRGWLGRGAPCSWRGVICDNSTGAVTGLDVHANTLYGMNAKPLSGTLPSQLALLTSLQTLYLHSNSLSGTLPSELGLLTSLSYLGIPATAHSLSSLSGTVPSELGLLTSLSDLYLHSSSLSGTVPSQLGAGLSSLTSIYMYSNSLSGSLPSQLAELTSLTDCHLTHTSERVATNRFSCPLPTLPEACSATQCRAAAGVHRVKEEL